MQFWEGNKIDGAFEMPVDDVARIFVTAMHNCQRPGCLMVSAWHEKLESWPLERVLRDWLTSPAGFNSSWTAETGPDSFEALQVMVTRKLYPNRVERAEQAREERTTACKACRSGRGRHTCGLSGLQDMLKLG